MRKLLRNALVTGAAAATTVGLAGTPAYADTRVWDVEPEVFGVPDRNPATTIPFSAISTDSRLTNRGVTLSCAEVYAEGDAVDAADAGTVHPTSPPYPVGAKGHVDVLDTVAEIISTTWTTCIGTTFIFNVTQVGSWFLKAEYQSGTKVYGAITNVVANISGSPCTAQIAGTAKGSYDNATGILTVNETGSGNLTVQPGASCIGILQAGDHPTFTANFAVDPGNLTINNVT
jgi:hypothetical protein